MITRIIVCISLALTVCGNLLASDIRIADIRISGNKITKDFTILRELPFRRGDMMPENHAVYEHPYP